MTKIDCVIDLFNNPQTLIIKKDDAPSMEIKCFFLDLPETLAMFASRDNETKIYLGGLSEMQMTPIKEEILNRSETKYSNKNVEVIII